MGRKTLLILIFVGITSLILFNFFLKSSIPSQNTSQTTANEVITPVKAEDLAKVDSPDGKLTLVMKKTSTKESVSYSFSISGKVVFEKTVPKDTSIIIPYNTWDPNNKYFFLKEEMPNGASFFALSATTDASEQNDQTANITNIFAQKYPNLKIQDATGWGGVNLIVFNSLKEDGSKGSSFWFEMPSHAIIQLSTHF